MRLADMTVAGLEPVGSRLGNDEQWTSLYVSR